VTADEFKARCDAIKADPVALRAAWEQGQLWFLLDHHQYKTYLRIRRQLTKRRGRFTLKWARRTGKTHLLILVAIEECLRHSGHRYNIAAATKESLAEFVWPAVHFILENCPESVRKTINVREARGRVVFSKADGRDSYCVLAGCNDRRSVERLRGPKSNGNILEEIGALPDVPGLNYIQTSVLNPQLLTTDGWTLRAGTPPPSTAHEAADAFRRAEMDPDTYSYATLYDNPRLTDEQVREYLDADAKELGMTAEEYIASADYRREWLALVETDPVSAVLPACAPERMNGADGKPPVIRVMPDVPHFRDRYVSMDLGFHPHFTALLFGYWDFPRQTLVIEDELLEQRLNDTRLAHLIRGDPKAKLPTTGKEQELWGQAEPYLRVADNNYPMTLSELSLVHGITFMPTPKDEKEAAILNVNRWIREGRVAVHPRCKHLIAQMQAAVWNKHRTEFAEARGMGHFDAVDALVYLVRNVIPNQNRVPHGWGLSRSEHHIPDPPPDDDVSPQDSNALARAFQL
jgi:hypothetical protein